MAGNMGYDTYLIPDGCATTNRIGIDGVDYDPEVVHAMTVANLHGEFCTAIKPSEAIALLRADATNLNRVQAMSSEDSDRFGVASMSGRLERVAVRKPSAILRADAAEWHYRKVLDPERLLSQFSSFIALLDRSGLRFFGLMMNLMI